MSDALISLFIGAGVAAVAYSKLGRRVGYGNSKNVWTMVIVVFIFVFLVVISLLEFVLHIH